MFRGVDGILSSFDLQIYEALEAATDNTQRVIMVARGSNNTIYDLYRIEVLKDPSFRNIILHGLRRPLLVGEFVPESLAKVCKELHVDYVDEQGNVSLEFGDVYINIRSSRSIKAPLKISSPGMPANLFSKRRAQVIFALFTWPEIVRWRVREIADVSGVSIGQVQTTLKDLEYQGYLMREESQLAKVGELFRLWLLSYPTSLMPSLRLEEFQGDPDKFDPVLEGALLSGESAVPFGLHPASLTLYMSELTPETIVRNRWTRSQRPNIFIRKKFWKDPSQVRPVGGKYEYEDENIFAPATLVYADLIASGDSRQKDIANNLIGDNERLFKLTSE